VGRIGWLTRPNGCQRLPSFYSVGGPRLYRMLYLMISPGLLPRIVAVPSPRLCPYSGFPTRARVCRSGRAERALARVGGSEYAFGRRRDDVGTTASAWISPSRSLPVRRGRLCRLYDAVSGAPVWPEAATLGSTWAAPAGAEAVFCMGGNPVMESNEGEIVARGPSTRPYLVRDAGYMESFAREALVSMVDQVDSGYVKMSVEHLSYLPPIGHWYRAEVEDDEEGHSQLVMYGRYLSMYRAADSVLPEGPATPISPAPDLITGVSIGTESRNFEPEIWESLQEESPLPVHEDAQRSALPLLLWIISVPVVWGVTKFMGSFLERLGDAAANGLVDWIKNQAHRARDNSRDNIVEVQFEVSRNLTVSAFLTFNIDMSATVGELRDGLNRLGPVASFAGWMTGDEHPADVRLVAFFYKDGVWNLGWWASPDSAYVTEWFERNYPDPKRFLGRPLFVIPNNQELPDSLILPSDYESRDER